MLTLSLSKMGIEEVFQNLTPEELQKANAWLHSLRQPEVDRVQDTLRILNRRELYLEDFRKTKRTNIAVIAAGSSIGGKNYPDIDLFLLGQYPLSPEEDLDPQEEATLALRRALPLNVEFIMYGKTVIRAEIKDSQTAVDEKVGVLVTVSLFYDLSGFRERRNSHPNDLLEPKVAMGAEQLMQYNREQSSKFLVLSRQYSI